LLVVFRIQEFFHESLLHFFLHVGSGPRHEVFNVLDFIVGTDRVFLQLLSNNLPLHVASHPSYVCMVFFWNETKLVHLDTLTSLNFLEEGLLELIPSFLFIFALVLVLLDDHVEAGVVVELNLLVLAIVSYLHLFDC